MVYYLQCASIVLLNIICFFMPLQENPLQEYQWNNRVLLLFTPDFEDDRYKAQVNLLLPESDAWKERQVKTFAIGLKDDDQQQFSKNDIDALRKIYKINESECSVILIGKDGGEKMRSEEIVAPNDIINLIDSMPMRKQEMKKTMKK